MPTRSPSDENVASPIPEGAAGAPPDFPDRSEARSSRSQTGRGRKRAAWLLAAYLVPLAALVLSVRLSDIGVPQFAEAIVLRLEDVAWVPGLRFGHLEAAANILVFVPIGFLLAGLMGRRGGFLRADHRGASDVAVWLVATCFSAAIELAQLFLLTHRSATVRDLICNSAGALVGVLVFRAAQIARQRHRRRRHHDH